MEMIIGLGATIGAMLIVGIAVRFFLKQARHQRMKKLADKLSRSGEQLNLRFSSTSVVADGVLGLDGVYRKILYIQHNKRSIDDEMILIDLKQVKHCTVRKLHRTIYLHKQRIRKAKAYLEKISLRFEFEDGSLTKEIPFYLNKGNNNMNAVELLQKANQWEAIISKMIRKQERQRA